MIFVLKKFSLKYGIANCIRSDVDFWIFVLHFLVYHCVTFSVHKVRCKFSKNA